MRIRESRGEFYASQRNSSIYRIAFIGDSFTYGQGVSPDKTMPARAETRFNELLPIRPVLAVNLAVPGYNLLNAWLSFKANPECFDGLVITVCYNDADLFCRSFKVQYQEPRSQNWELGSPYGEAVTKCFVDISAFRDKTDLNIAFCYHNCWDSPSNRRIGEIIAAHCQRSNIPFVNGFERLRALNFPAASLRISEADGHPSADAHDAVGRHVAETLVRLGWGAETKETTPAESTEHILLTAVKLAAEDGCSEAGALNWALTAAEAKQRSARRLRLDPADQTLLALSRTIDALRASSSYWHLTQRLKVFLDEAAMGGFRLGTSLWDCQELRLKLVEVDFALALENWPAIYVTLADYAARQPELLPAAANWRDFSPTAVVAPLDAALRGLEYRLAGTHYDGLAPNQALNEAYSSLSRLVGKICNECHALQLALEAFAHRLDATNQTGQQRQIVETLIQSAVSQLGQSQLFAPVVTALERLIEIKPMAFTTIEITLRAPPAVEKDSYWLTVQGEYNHPHRLLFSDSTNFLADGTSWTVSAYLPTLYAGRLTLRPWYRSTADQVIEVTLEKVEIYNQSDQRRQIPLGQFRRDRFGQYVSTMIWVI